MSLFVIFTDNDCQHYENKTQVVMNHSYTLITLSYIKVLMHRYTVYFPRKMESFCFVLFGNYICTTEDLNI